MIGSPSMHSGELIFHFLNTIVLRRSSPPGCCGDTPLQYSGECKRGAARWLRWRSRST